MHLHQREHERDESRRQDIGHEVVHSNAGSAAPELVGNHRSGRGCRADQADHRTLEYLTVSLIHRNEYQHPGHHQGRERLECQYDPVPPGDTQILEVYLAEGKEQLYENQRRSKHLHRLPHRRLHRRQKSCIMKEEIASGTRQHGYRQDPVLQKLPDTHSLSTSSILLNHPGR